MTHYVILYWLNLLCSIFIAAGSYYVSANEVNISRRKAMGALSFFCGVEIAILALHTPPNPPPVWDTYVTQTNLALLWAKFVLKPPLLGIMIYNVVSIRSKMHAAAKHGQKSAVVIPQSLERVIVNQHAAELAKIDAGVALAKESGVVDETIHKLIDPPHAGEGSVST